MMGQHFSLRSMLAAHKLDQCVRQGLPLDPQKGKSTAIGTCTFNQKQLLETLGVVGKDISDSPETLERLGS